MSSIARVQKLINWVITTCKNSTFHKVLLVVVLVCVALFIVCACSSHRQFNVSVDKADSVKINYTDSISAVYPSF